MWISFGLGAVISPLTIVGGLYILNILDELYSGWQHKRKYYKKCGECRQYYLTRREPDDDGNEENV
jgi:hypothetical protein